MEQNAIIVIETDIYRVKIEVSTPKFDKSFDTLSEAQSWSRLGPKLLSLYLVQILEMGVDMIEWSQQQDVLLLTSELICSHCDSGPIQKRYLSLLMKNLNIIKLVFTDKPYVEEIQEASSPSTPPGQSSPSIARRFRKLLPSGGDDKKETKGEKG